MNPANTPKDNFENEAIRAIMSGADHYARRDDVNVCRRSAVPLRTRPQRRPACSCHTNNQVGDTLGMLSLSLPIVGSRGAFQSIDVADRWADGRHGDHDHDRHLCLAPEYRTEAAGKNERYSRDIAKGEGDLTKRVPSEGNDEIAHMGGYFNEFIEKLQHMIKKSGDSHREWPCVGRIVRNRRGNIRGTDTSTLGAGLTNRRGSRRDERDGRSGGAESRQGRQLGAGYRQDRARGRGRGVEHDLRDAAIVRVVANRRRSSSDLGNRPIKSANVRTIEDIADQTNCWLTPRSAARAGTSKAEDLAVAADEVRKLAERTTKATKEIGDMIRQIQHDTRGAVDSMQQGTQKVTAGVDLVNKTGEALSQIVRMVSESADMIRQIAVASEQQSVATQQIASDIENVAKVTKESSSGAHESAKASQDLSQLAVELQGIVGGFRI